MRATLVQGLGFYWALDRVVQGLLLGYLWRDGREDRKKGIQGLGLELRV